MLPVEDTIGSHAIFGDWVTLVHRQPIDHLQELAMTEGDGMAGAFSGFKHSEGVTRTLDKH